MKETVSEGLWEKYHLSSLALQNWDNLACDGMVIIIEMPLVLQSIHGSGGFVTGLLTYPHKIIFTEDVINRFIMDGLNAEKETSIYLIHSLIVYLILTLTGHEVRVEIKLCLIDLHISVCLFSSYSISAFFLIFFCNIFLSMLHFLLQKLFFLNSFYSSFLYVLPRLTLLLFFFF